MWFSHISRLSCGDAEKSVTICKCILVLLSFADILSMEKELHCSRPCLKVRDNIKCFLYAVQQTSILSPPHPPTLPYVHTHMCTHTHAHTHAHAHAHTHAVFEMLAQCQMIWMLLSMSVGWTLGSSTAHPIRDKRQLGTITAVAVLHVSQVGCFGHSLMTHISFLSISSLSTYSLLSLPPSPTSSLSLSLSLDSPVFLLFPSTLPPSHFFFLFFLSPFFLPSSPSLPFSFSPFPPSGLVCSVGTVI